MHPSRVLAWLLAVLVVLSAVSTGALAASDGERVTDGDGRFVQEDRGFVQEDTRFVQEAIGFVQEDTRFAQDTSGSLSQSTFRVVRGEDVEITFSHSGPASLYVGGDDAGYLLRVNVSGSGTSTVTIDTYASTSANPDNYVEGGDATLVYPEGGLTKSLVATSYTLNLTVGGTPQDLGLLVIEGRPPASMTATIAPGSLDLTETDHGGLQSATTQRDTVAKGDYAVLEINATGLSNALDPEDLTGSSNAAGIEVAFEDLEPQPNVDGDSFVASASTVDTFWDEETANLLVVWDTDDVALDGGTHRYNVTLRIEAEHNNLLTEDTLESHTNVTVVKPRIDLETDQGQLEVYPWESDVVTLRGTTNYAPGSAFEFRAQAFQPRPFLKKSDTEVGTDGNFSAEMDVGDVARGIEFPLWVLGHREVNAWDIRIYEQRATFEFENQTAETGDVARFGNVSFSAGGFLVLERPNGTVLGVSVPIGEDTNSSVNVGIDPPLSRSSYVTATAYMDWNQNGSFEPGTDRPYTRSVTQVTNGTNVTIEQNVSKTAVVFVPETGDPEPPDTTTVGTTTPIPTNNSTTSTNSTNVTTTTNTSTVTTLSVQSQDPLTPGTTSGNAPIPLGLPVIALLVVALLFRRGVE